MTAIRRTLFVLLLVALTASAGHAANPFARLDALKVSVEVGGPLDLEGNPQRALLVDDLRRFNVFHSKLTRELEKHVEACGFLADPGATEEISVTVSGRAERWEGGPVQFVFLVEVGASSSRPGVDPAGRELAPTRRVLGLAADADFEQSVIDAALAALPDDLQNCEKS